MPIHDTPTGPIETLEMGDGLDLAVLVHATAAGPRSLGRLGAKMAEDGWRVVAPAFDVYGATRLDADSGLTPVLRNAAIVRWALARPPSPRRSLLFGHSMGGLVALEAILGGGSTDLLALYEPITLSLLDPEDPADQKAREMDRRLVQGLAEAVEGATPERGVAAFVEAWNDVRWSDLRPADRDKLTAMAPHLVRETQGTNAHVLDRPALAALPCPTVVMGGQASPFLAHRLVAAVAGAISGAQRAVLPELGHFAPVTNSGPVWRAISAGLDLKATAPTDL